ncbi:hypothetical protein [Cryptosporangium sp. NPDC048952]|uniref:hypothetical protein n=1 Tax=Cryptosporangium sp. NPDC048952 TaxID=3363961 RepID=UPI0037193403
MTDLNAFVGEWTVELRFPGAPPVTGAHSVFEWILDGAYLQQRNDVPISEVPNAQAIYAPGAEPGTYTQHYFDTRGVSRLYAMTFDGTTWTLLREAADFSPLDFRQRFTATFDGDRIEGAWEIAHPGKDWEHDFAMTYIRLR